MKTINKIKTTTVLLLAALCMITAKGSAKRNYFRPMPMAKNNYSTAIIDMHENDLENDLENAEMEIIRTEDSKSDIIVNYNDESFKVDLQKTYFMPGAGFDIKGDRTSVNFTNELIDTCSTIFGDEFVIVKESSKKIPFKPLRAGLNGKWAIMKGYKPIDYKKHKNVYRTVKEVESDFLASNTDKALNIIGSSYGSVIAAQSAIAILERDNNIDKIGTLVITASMIDPYSALGLKLEALQAEGKIDNVYYHPNANDNVTACSGKSKKEAKQGFREVLFRGEHSIMNMKKHAHNIAANDPTRAHHILEVIVNNTIKTGIDNMENTVVAIP